VNEMPVVVLDPGHGGGPDKPNNRGSSWNRARGPNGLLEKDVVFDLALRTAARLRDHARVEITRSEQDNPSLGERADLARRSNANVFLSLHLNGSHNREDDGTDVYVAPDAPQSSRAFGESVWRRLSSVTGGTRGGLSARDFGTLVRSRHAPATAACLAEVAYLTNERQASALQDEGYRNRIADALSDAIREHVTTTAAVTTTLGTGDGSPFAARATIDCWARCQELRNHASEATNPNVVAAQRIRSETGVVADANPYFGITQMEIDAVVRAAFETYSMPELLLALWAKEGSTQTVTSPMNIPQATSDANARAIFRSHVFYEHLGLDHFVATRYDPALHDNVWDNNDSAASSQEALFTQQVRDLVNSHHLHQDIAGDINSELSVARSGGVRTVLPTRRFYSLALMLADAFWAKLLSNTFPQLASITDGLNYIQWNIRNFGTFLTSADGHRQEPRHRVQGQPISIDQWALHTTPAPSEYAQPRINAIKFLHYLESYRPIFRDSITLIKPGIEDLPQNRPGTRTAELEVAESFAPVFFPNTHLFTPPAESVPVDMTVDHFSGAPHTMTHATTRMSTLADVAATFPPADFVEDPPLSNDFIAVPTENFLRALPFFDVSNPARLRVVLRSVICYPADPADANRLAGSDRFPVAIIVHGNHRTIANVPAPTRTGPPVPVTGGGTIAPGTIGPITAVLNHTGYSNSASGPTSEYLQEELAHHGFVSMSIDQNCANFLNLDFSTRGELILVYLDQLKRIASAATPNNRFLNRLDFNRVALIGHSRGGDAVVEAVRQNSARPAATKVGIRSAVSLAPTDITGEMAPVPGGLPLRMLIIDNVLYCVVYGSHDGDVRGDGDGRHVDGTGFTHYDRATSHRAMVFIHGACHNRFNRVWNDLPNDGDPSHTTADTSDLRLLSRAQHETLAKQYISGWLRYSMLSDWDQQKFFNGSNPNALGTDVSLQWKFGRDLRTVEDSDDATPGTNTLLGHVTPTSVTEERTDDQNDPDPVLPGFHRPTFPNDDRVLKAVRPATGRARVVEEIPAANANLSGFTHLTFRITRKYPIDSAGLSTAPFPDVDVTLIDGSGIRVTVNNATVLAQNARKTRPYLRRVEQTAGLLTVTRNITKCNLETWRVPLNLFNSGGLHLNDIRGVEISFGPLPNEPVYLDTITFVKL
jgi:N-acetylmuramoyl-L-alanine amidase